MRQILTHMSVETAAELSLFEREVVKLTLGYSIKRCMAYNDFRMSVQKYHQSGVCHDSKSVLAQNHFISLHDGSATLYRLVDEDNKDDHDDQKDVDDAIDDKPNKRVKCAPK
jgi:hypothetical protein